MVLKVPYERQPDTPKAPVLEAGAGGVTLTIPVKGYWFELGVLAFYCCAMWLQVAASIHALMLLVQMMPNGTTIPVDLRMTFIVPPILLALWASFCTAFLYRRCRLGPVPRRLHLSAGELRQTRRGIWRVVTRTYPLSRVTEIRCNTIKGFLGKPAGATVIIRLGKWRAIRIRFGRKQMDLAKQVTAEFQRVAESVKRRSDPHWVPDRGGG